MNKAELVKAVAEATKLSQKDTAAVLNAAFDTIADTLAAGESIKIVGFGTFAAHKRAARTSRNPRTGEAIQIAASTTPAFKPGNGLKEAVNKK